jgi:hypothetical protein
LSFFDASALNLAATRERQTSAREQVVVAARKLALNICNVCKVRVTSSVANHSQPRN